MPKEKLSMFKTKELLRLKHELGLSNRKITAPLWDYPCDGGRLPAAGRASRAGLAAAGGDVGQPIGTTSVAFGKLPGERQG